MSISFGFIKIEGEDKDSFFHQSDVEGGEAAFKTLMEGDAVEFEKGTGDKGPKAMKVKKAGAATATKATKATKAAPAEIEDEDEE